MCVILLDFLLMGVFLRTEMKQNAVVASETYEKKNNIV